MKRNKFSYLIIQYCLYLASVSFVLFSFKTNNLLDNLSGWFRDAVPSVLGVKYCHLPSDYSVNKTIKEIYNKWCQSTKYVDIDCSIQKIRQLRKSSLENKQEVLGSDDKGLVDFVRLAFLFSESAKNINYLYIILLIVSTQLNFLNFFKNQSLLLLQNCLLLGFAAICPLMASSSEIQSFLSPRYLPIAAIFPCFFFIFDKTETKTLSLIVGILQAGILIFLCHVRITIIASVIIVVFHLMQKILRNPKNIINLLLILSVFIFIGAKSIFFWSSISPLYFEKPNTPKRVFWHNIVSGFACSPFFHDTYNLKIDDVSIIRATGRYLEQNGEERLWDQIGGNSENYSKIWWQPYDSAAKRLYFYFWKTNPLEAVLSYFIYKPKILFSEISWLLNPDKVYPNKVILHESHAQSMDHVGSALAKKPIKIFNIYVIIFTVLHLTAVLNLKQALHVRANLRGIFMLCLISLLPPLIGYPLLHCIGEFLVVLFGIFYYLANCILLDLHSFVLQKSIKT